MPSLPPLLNYRSAITKNLHIDNYKLLKLKLYFILKPRKSHKPVTIYAGEHSARKHKAREDFLRCHN